MDFESSIESIDDVTRKVKVTIPVERVTKEISVALDDMTKSARLKGFRPGKAPRELVEKMHGERLRWEVANRLINSSLQELVKEHKIEMIGSPEVDIADFAAGKAIEYTANISVFPNPEIVAYDSFKVEVPKREVQESDIQDVLNNMQENKATLRKLEFRNTVQKSDVIDALVSVKVEEEEKARPEPLVVAVGEGKLPAELDSGLIGMEVGQTKDFEIVHGEDHREVALRGKKAIYTVTLQALSEKILPEINDEFAKSLQFGVETLLELRMKISKQLEEETKRGGDSDIHAAILDVLVKANNFQVPQALIDEEIRGLLARNGLIDPKNKEFSKISVEPFRESLGEMAAKRVRSAIIVDRITVKEGLKVEDADIDKELTELAERNSVTKEEVQQYLIKERMLNGIIMDLARNKTLEFLVARAEVTYTDPKKDENKKEEK